MPLQCLMAVTRKRGVDTAGFSLVELSIVLVILGLLVGGVLSGQALIRASELRAVTAEYSRYFAATKTFRDKYFVNPGDMNNATQFWGRMNGNADCVTNSAAAVNASAGACDGNADGVINSGGGLSQSGEIFQYWRELALAGLIEGNYTGLAGPTAGAPGTDSIIGTNVPKSHATNAGWSIMNFSNYAGNGSTYAFDYGNVLVFGAQVPGLYTYGATLKPEDAWNIDTKIDDGKPGTGGVIGHNWSQCANSASNTDYTGTYQVSTTSISCSLWFAKVF